MLSNFTLDDCSIDEFQCTDGECIHLDKVCDHKVDCTQDGNDEFCGRFTSIRLFTSFDKPNCVSFTT